MKVSKYESSYYPQLKIGPFVHLAEGFVPTLPKKEESDFNENSRGKKK